MQIHSEQLSPYSNPFPQLGGDPALPNRKERGGDFAENNWNVSRGVEVSLSSEALEKLALDHPSDGGLQEGLQTDSADQQELKELKQTDQKVRAHEQAHLSVGGDLVKGGAHYQYKVGPDGSLYAVAGEVQIDTSAEKDPEATIRKAQRIRSAALAPADPSAQDRRVASEASAMEEQARREIAKEKEENQVDGGVSLSSDYVSAHNPRTNPPSRYPIQKIGHAYQGVSGQKMGKMQTGVTLSV